MHDLSFPIPAAAAVPRELRATLGGVTISGTSVAARATAFALPDLGVALDIGRLTGALAAQPVVLLSHTHMDHLAGLLAYLNLRARFFQDLPPRVVCPAPVAGALREALAVMPGMEAVRKRLALDEVIVGAEPGDRIDLPHGVATAFPVDHSVPSLGWRLARSEGERALVAYAGDGTTEPFEAAPERLDATVALVECTFIEPNRRVAARLSKHAHVVDWAKLAGKLTCDHLVLIHLPELDRDRLRELGAPVARAFSGHLTLWAG